MSSEITIEQQLCVGCGMCCDGSLFNFVYSLDDLAQKTMFKQKGLDYFTNERGEESFHQPCTFFSKQTGCTIYSEPRPLTCINFRCTLLRRVEKGEYTLEAATEIVKSAKQMQAELRPLFENPDPSMGFLKAFQQYNKQLPEDPKQFSKEEAKIVLLMIRCKMYMIKYFYPGHQKNIVDGKSLVGMFAVDDEIDT